MKIGHKDYTLKPEIFEGKIPSTEANIIADMYKLGYSENDVAGELRINGQKVSLSTIKVVYGHIETIEKTIVNILNGTSIIYNEASLFWVDEEIESLIPEDRDTLIQYLLTIIEYDKDNFLNVYYVDFIQLTAQIGHVVDNIISVQNKGNGTFEDLKNSIKMNE